MSTIKNVIVISVDDATECMGIAATINQLLDALQGARILTGEVTMVGGHRLSADDEFTQRIDSLFQEMVKKTEVVLPDNVVPISNAVN